MAKITKPAERSGTITGPDRERAASITLEEVQALLGATILCAPDRSVTFASVAAADLMSDVLAFCRPGMLLLTGLPTVQAVRAAAIADLKAVVFVRGKKPDQEVVALAQETGIPVLTTPLTMFEAAGILYQSLSAAGALSRTELRGNGSG